MKYKNSMTTAIPFSLAQWVLISAITIYSVGNLWLYMNIETISNGWAAILTYGNIGSYIVFGILFVAISLKTGSKTPLLALGIAFLAIMVAGFGILLNSKLAGLLAIVPTHKLGDQLYYLIGNAVVAIPGLCFAILLFRIINDNERYADLMNVEINHS